MFDTIRSRIVEIEGAPARVAEVAAPRIEARLRSDSTTKRGNVPCYGKFGDIPTTATALPAAVEVSAVDWVIEQADKRGQIDEWVGIVKSAVADEVA